MEKNMGQIGWVIMVFVGLIITASILPEIANEQELITGLFSIANGTFAVPAAVNSTTELTGRDLVTELSIVNATSVASGDVVGLILQQGFGSDGLLHVQLFANDTASNILGNDVNVTYTFRQAGFVGNSNVGVTTLITLFAALAMVVFSIVMLFQGPLSRLLKKE
jgi:hypothetical protein